MEKLHKWRINKVCSGHKKILNNPDLKKCVIRPNVELSFLFSAPPMEQNLASYFF